MWTKFVHWLHHLFDPHCDVCVRDRKCPNCELMLNMLESERRDKNKILDALVNKDKPVIIQQEQENYKPVVHVRTWDQKRRELELAERERILEENRRANEIIEKKVLVKTTEDLEKELEIVNE